MFRNVYKFKKSTFSSLISHLTTWQYANWNDMQVRICIRKRQVTCMGEDWVGIKLPPTGINSILHVFILYGLCSNLQQLIKFRKIASFIKNK